MQLSKLARLKVILKYLLSAGGNLGTEIEVTDTELFGFFSLSEFPTARIDKPEEPGKGFTILRGGKNQGVFVPFDRLQYYPNLTGSGGFVFYEGLVNDEGLISGWSEYDGQWYLASSVGDATLRRILKINSVGNDTLTADSSVRAPGYPIFFETHFGIVEWKWAAN